MVFTIGYGVTLCLLLSRGLSLPLTVAFLAFLLLVTFPSAYLVFRVSTSFNEHKYDRIDFRLISMSCLAGFGVIGLQWLLMIPWIGLAALFLFVWDLLRRARHLLLPSAQAIVVLALGYGAIWNLNYSLLDLVHLRLHDQEVMNLDLNLYRVFFSGNLAVEGLFPIVRSQELFLLLENSYPCLFLQILVILLLLLQNGGPFRSFLADVFGCYLCGLIVFMFYPVVGPCIAFPESFSADFHGTLTHVLMQGMHNEYLAVLSGKQLSGYGYFIAIPSLHVSMALLFQVYLWRFRMLFWCFLPVNILMSTSTFLLGYHYIVDYPTGLMVPPLVMGIRVWLQAKLPSRLSDVGVANA